jgi:hypothetical protein
MLPRAGSIFDWPAMFSADTTGDQEETVAATINFIKLTGARLHFRTDAVRV